METPSKGVRARRWFYFAFSIVVAGIIFAGFAKNYYLRAWFGTRAITPMVHIHGLVMTAWVLTFLVQSLLVAKRRIDLHKRLGVAAAALAAVVVVLGVCTIAGSIVRQHLDGSAQSDALAFVAFDGISLLLFGGLVLVALRLRSRPEVHRRLMVMAMVSLLPPAFGRVVAYFTLNSVPLIVLLLMCLAVLVCIAVDSLRTSRRPHLAFAWSGGLVILSNLFTYFAQNNL